MCSMKVDVGLFKKFFEKSKSFLQISYAGESLKKLIFRPDFQKESFPRYLEEMLAAH